MDKTKSNPGQEACTSVTEWDGIMNGMLKSFGNHARAALQELVTAGCNQEMILEGLYLYCGGDPKKAQKGQKAIRQKKVFLTKTAQQLRALADQVDSCFHQLKEKEFVIGVESAVSAAGQMRSTARLFEVSAHALCEAGNGKVKGRVQYLEALVETVERVTGREHYAELALLIEATLEKHDPDAARMVDAGLISKTVRRFRKRQFGPSKRKSFRK